MKKEYAWIIVSGVLVGVAALVLTALGNPANMGFCIACFERDIAGSLGLHSAAKVQYFRPEIVGLVLGACISALVSHEFRAKAGSSPATRFILGAVVMIGALMFLGCPLRMVLRIGGGDGNALFGLLGFVAGASVGVFCLNKGFSLGRAYPARVPEGSSLTGVLLLFFVLVTTVPSMFKQSTEGPGAKHAAVWIGLLIAAAVGVLCQRSRMCLVGGVRDMMLFRDPKLLIGFVSVLITTILGNLILGKFDPGFMGQPIAHSGQLWNVLGMMVVGWGSVLLGGCPLRQLILAGEGNGDSAITVFGMIIGAAISHNFGLAGIADSVNETGELVRGGIGDVGKIAVCVCILVLAFVSFYNTVQTREKKRNG